MSNIRIIGTPLYQWEHGRKVQVIPLRGMRVDAVHFCNFGDTEALVVLPTEENGMIVANIPNILLQSGENLVVHSVNVSADSVETIMDCTLAVRSRAKPSDYVYTETELYTIKTAVDKALLEAKESGEFDGEKGDPGYTPQKGVDYYTEEEKAALIAEIENDLGIEELKGSVDEIEATASIARDIANAAYELAGNSLDRVATIESKIGEIESDAQHAIFVANENAGKITDLDNRTQGTNERVDALIVDVGSLQDGIGDIETALDGIIAIQENLIGGASV